MDVSANDAAPPGGGAISSIFELGSEQPWRPSFLGGIDENRLIGHFTDDFSGGEKLSLYDFIVQEFGLKQLEVLREPGEALLVTEQHEFFRTQIDLLSLDATTLRSCEPALVERLLERLSPKGIVCIESSEGVGKVDAGILPLDRLERVMAAPGFAVYAQSDGERSPSSVRYQIDLFRRRRYVERKRLARAAGGPRVPEVAVIVLACKHEASIADCLNSILRQRGQFIMRLLIIDDASSDRTAQIARSVLAEYSDEGIKVELRTNPQSVGASANWGQALSWAEGADYVAPCGGDDIWNSEQRIQDHIDFLRRWPKAVVSSNAVSSSPEVLGRQSDFTVAEENIYGSKIIEDNPVVCPGAAFYRGEIAEIIPSESFQSLNDIWTANIYCCQFGSIGYINKTLTTTYSDPIGTARNAPWSEIRAIRILSSISRLNRLLDFNFREEFERLSRFCYSLIGESVSPRDSDGKKVDIVILDDTFPTQKNGFRYLEYTAYLREFPSSLVLSSGAATHLVDNTPHDMLILMYQRKYPVLGPRVFSRKGQFPLHLAKLIYIMFLHNVYASLQEIEDAGVPFIFTLYPGGGFALNNPSVDRQLRRVFASPCFRKVIVTQQVIYDYVVRKGLCPAGKIELIYGGVMPEVPAGGGRLKRRWGFEKTRLDICFMAHKYTPRGEDKGYDVFIEVAKILQKRHNNIYFHVAGGFDRHVIDVSSLGDRIRFHGPLTADRFDSFFREIDIIISPNISGKIYSGSIDGFPTGCCVDAGMRGTAIFATDEFDSARRCFVDGKDIVIINYDPLDVVDKVERYYANPEALRSVGERGIISLRDMHSMQSQLVPRINLLREAIRNSAPAGEAPILRMRIAMLQAEMQAEIEAREEQIAAMRASRSWRLSAPVRFVGHLARRDFATAGNVIRVALNALRRRLR